MIRRKITMFVVFRVCIFYIVISFYTKPEYVDNYLTETKIPLNKSLNVLKDPRDRNLDERKKQKQTGKPKLKRILYWTKIPRMKEFCCGRGPYKKNKCAHDTCFTSQDRTEDLSTFDAIVFHGRNLNKYDLPPHRYDHQFYIFLLIESAAYPGNTHFPDWDGYFNLTMTFRTDSDIPMPYGKVSKRDKIIKRKPVVWKSKRKVAAWFVSHCVTHSRRERLVNKLVEHLPPNSLDIYGYCGPEKCPRENETKESCWEKVENNYKFYLSLENSICKDYVTEKMFEALKHDVVPVVLGGANYSAIFPEKSFINMQEFSSMKKLAEYLLKVGRNKSEYLEYFKWKEDYEILNSKQDFNQAHCGLCQFLHENDGKRRVVNNLTKWWVEDSKCFHREGRGEHLISNVT